MGEREGGAQDPKCPRAFPFTHLGGFSPPIWVKPTYARRLPKS